MRTIANYHVLFFLTHFAFSSVYKKNPGFRVSDFKPKLTSLDFSEN